jgi:hypothetical protein
MLSITASFSSSMGRSAHSLLPYKFPSMFIIGDQPIGCRNENKIGHVVCVGDEKSIPTSIFENLAEKYGEYQLDLEKFEESS